MNGKVIVLFEAVAQVEENTDCCPLPTAESPCDETERIRAIKQNVLADVTCVLAKSSGVDIDPKRAFAAARNLCEILFSHPHRPGAVIPKLFWETPLGRAVGACCGDKDNSEETAGIAEPLVKTTLHLPQSVSERLRLEAEVAGTSVSELLAERLSTRL